MESNVFMKKNGIKNFIFSFFMSLLAVIVVNKVVLDAPENIKNDKKEKKSSVKTISLFSETKDNTSYQSKNNIEFDAIDTLVAETTGAEIPALDIKNTEPKIVYEPELINNDKAIEQVHNTTPDHKNYIDIASASEIKLETEPNTSSESFIEKTTTTPVAEVVYADISDTFADEMKLQEQNIASEEIIIAQNDILPLEESTIPLTENNETLHNKIDILTSSEANQIAMLEPSVLVSSINSLDDKEETNIAEINLKEKTVVANSQETSLNTADSPWVVAQGNKFAKNKIAQINNIEKQNDTTDTNTNKNAEQEAKTEIPNEPTKENVITVHKEDANIDTTQKADTTSDTDKHISKEDVADKAKTDNIQKNNQSSLLAPKPLLIPTDGQSTKLAYKMIQNLIIPLPDDIATDADIVPQLSSEPNEKNNKPEKLKKEDKESSLFKSISSWFSRNKKDKVSDKKETEKNNVKQVKKKTSNKKKSGISLFEINTNEEVQTDDVQNEAPEIMPAELKLSFQPNRAEISGHTLRWIHAFADNARDNPGIYIEIRIDGTNSFALQQKRLNLLSSIFANRGVDFRKVNIVFTSREPNSFIIRNIRFNDSEESNNQTDNGSLYQHW